MLRRELFQHVHYFVHINLSIALFCAYSIFLFSDLAIGKKVSFTAIVKPTLLLIVHVVYGMPFCKEVIQRCPHFRGWSRGVPLCTGSTAFYLIDVCRMLVLSWLPFSISSFLRCSVGCCVRQ